MQIYRNREFMSKTRIETSRTINLPDAVQEAMELHRQGLLTEAENFYTAILKVNPDHFDALHLLGVLKHQCGEANEALRLISLALQKHADVPEALSNLGLVLHTLHRYDEALASFDRALALKPDYAEAFYNRGNALRALNRHEEAVASFERALAIRPDYAEALYNCATVLGELKRPAEALARFDRALAIRPDHAEALNNRAAALQALNRYEEALASFDRVLAIKPDFVEALSNRGAALGALKRHVEAVASCDRALAIKPDYVEALYNHGNALLALDRHKEALAIYDRALAIKPDYADVLNNRGILLQALRRHDEAIADFERTLSVDPGRKYVRGKLLHSKMHCCVWDAFEETAAQLARDVQAGKQSIMPLELIAVSESAADQLRCSQIFVQDGYPPSSSPVWQGEHYRHDKIRVAYLSADFHDHATACLMAGLFELHDRKRFETIAIAFGPDKPSEMRRRLEAAFDRFIDVRRKSDREAASMLHEMEVDIAVDLKGFTADSRTGIFALRPAPIQVNYLGFPGTMGAEYIDYILADRWVVPEEQQQYYTEKVVYLPDSYQVNDSKRRIGERTPTRAEAGLPETGFVFCCFNNNYKITPFMFDIWMRLLRQVEGSVLWLVEGNAAVVRNLRREAEKRGVSPDRLIFAPRAKPEDHLARHRLIDLFLDTLPYNAHTTASDALWVGVPIVTCLGSTFAGRVAASLLHAVGLPELITHSLEDYEALAFRLANDKSMLAAIKAKLAQNRAAFPLFNTDRFRRNIEKAYVTMWERHQRGEPPASFAVP